MNRKHKAGDNMSFEVVSNLLRTSVFRLDPATDACPEETEYAGLIGGTLPDEERARLADHLAHCQQCLDLVTCLVRIQDRPQDQVPQELLAAALKLGSDSQAMQLPARFQWQTSLAAAAGLILVVGVLFTQYPQLTDIVLRGDSSQPVDPASQAVRLNRQGQDHLSILSPEEGAAIDSSKPEFRWSGVDQSLYYEFQVLSDNGDILWEGRTEETQLQLPPEFKLDRDTSYFVWVRVYLPDGKTIKSRAVAVRVD
jgi:hypothetical protein